MVNLPNGLVLRIFWFIVALRGFLIKIVLPLGRILDELDAILRQLQEYISMIPNHEEFNPVFTLDTPTAAGSSADDMSADASSSTTCRELPPREPRGDPPIPPDSPHLFPADELESDPVEWCWERPGALRTNAEE